LQHLIRERVDIRWARDRLFRGPAEVNQAITALVERTASLGSV